jgi:uncharacterized protein YceK
MRRTALVAIPAILAYVQCGCGTFSDTMCGPIDDHVFYRGVRLDIMAAQDGGWTTLMIADIPFSAVADTLLLPCSIYNWSHPRSLNIDRLHSDAMQPDEEGRKREKTEKEDAASLSSTR